MNRLIPTAMILLASVTAAHATTITYVASLIDAVAGPGWRNTTVAKGEFDITTPGVIGEAGYDVTGVAGSLSLPSLSSAALTTDGR